MKKTLIFGSLVFIGLGIYGLKFLAPADTRVVSPAAPSATVTRQTLFQKLAVVADRVEITLPAGKSAVAVVERVEVDAAGNWVMTEGRLTAPAEGRFLFRRQPEGTPSGRYAGAIRFPGESYGYLLEEGAAGEPLLTFHDADQVSCVEYPLPPPE